MAVRLSRALKGPKELPVGLGVTFQFKPFGFAQYREAQAWAQREAREQLTGAQRAALAGREIDELGDEFEDRLIGLASEMHLDRIVTQFCIGWDGVLIGETDEDAEPLSFSPANWEMLREQAPLLADLLDRRLQAPMHAVVTEGNGSALLPDTDTPEG
ncbi:MAG: hypothetical protein ACRBB0_27040 [Pelagimonas sp.]|uniref:hypothetical protein n=1 Tax=Pelagimonas sp. TaxID=2073170 RepID=UPI003D6BC738